MNRPRLGSKPRNQHRLESEQPKHECRARRFPGRRNGIEGPSLDRPRPGTRDHSKGIRPPCGNLVVRNAEGRNNRDALTILVSQYKHQLVSMSSRGGEGGGGGGRGMVVVAVAGVEGGWAGSGWVLYKVVRTPNSQYQWDFPWSNLRSTRSSSSIYTYVHQEVLRLWSSSSGVIPVIEK